MKNIPTFEEFINENYELLENLTPNNLVSLGYKFLKEHPISKDDNDGFGDCIQTSSDFIDWANSNDFIIIVGSPENYKPGLHEFHAAVLYKPTKNILDLTYGQFTKKKNQIKVYTEEEFKKEYPTKFNIDESVNAINELKKVYKSEVLDKAKEDEESIFVAWNNGDVIPGNLDNDDFQRLGFFPIRIKVDFKNKSILFWPMDDSSDFKYVKKVKQAIGDLIKAGYVDNKWEMIIANKSDTKKNLGGIKVKDLMNYDANFTKNIPIAFHGTSDYYLKDIQSKGLVPRDKTGDKENWDKGYLEGSKYFNYLTMDFSRAEYYANYTVQALKARGIESKPIVIEMKDLPINFVDADDDIITDMGSLNLLLFLHRGQQKKSLQSYIDGIRSSSQFSYASRIPANMITKIYKIK